MSKLTTIGLIALVALLLAVPAGVVLGDTPVNHPVAAHAHAGNDEEAAAIPAETVLMVCALAVPAASALASMRANPTDPAADVRLDNPADDVVETRCAATGQTVFEFPDGSRVRVIHISPGSILFAFGGPNKSLRAAEIKENIVLERLFLQGKIDRTLPVTLEETGLPVVGEDIEPLSSVRHFNESESRPYGNGHVFVAQEGTATRVSGFWTVTDTVDGLTRTVWTGTWPQFDSSEIKLDETWRFNGIGVTVSFPPGLGFSGSSDTVGWSAHDTSGTDWRLRHRYWGVSGESHVVLYSMTKSGSGSHFFTDDPQGPTWVTVFDRFTV